MYTLWNVLAFSGAPAKPAKRRAVATGSTGQAAPMADPTLLERWMAEVTWGEVAPQESMDTGQYPLFGTHQK
jgi:hypothetical protein